ncbi:putative DNA-binding protein in cluster with Type I restriction-modification system [Anaerovibrio sp. JC8]|uniref:virulence RhuM family protein n=1 Tax=Anaerovibrio sp. JC8 TaxID=1240085 RepID=UPI000A0B6122|nr:virulence RhuM family protein [Anaerovibrio sp. JC8]ORU01404.1 putative DNA-binding protein in cluster with Type I restriction-modification system [Anaerovibrio sp. JC8]
MFFFFFDDNIEDNIIIYNTDDGKANVKLYANDGTVWATQKAMAELFDVNIPAVNKHIKNIYAESELNVNSTISKMEIVQKEGEREVKRQVECYSLDMILAVGFRVRSPRGAQFRKWANTTLQEYLQKGFVLDDDRLKNPDGRTDYFDELLARIRDIRASEKRFYQKIKDLFALSSDYNSNDKQTQQFFTETQNKLIYGVTGMTAADLIVERADSSKPNMALTSWKGKQVRKADITISKNYLTEDELDSLNRLVTVFLESAELRVKMRKNLTLKYWKKTVDSLLLDHGIPILNGSGKHSHEFMVDYVSTIYSDFDNNRKHQEAVCADRDDMAELEQAIPLLKGNKR